MKHKRRNPETGEVILLDFPGVTVTKRRPAVIVSSSLYHRERPDVIVGLMTSQLGSASSLTDYVLEDWQHSRLWRPSAFRSFLITVSKSAITGRLGKLSSKDWSAVVQRLALALGQVE
ncbi:MAG TPA: type II toxin-antitoxin system PemK/MazF family toxin [Pyrinomonadaceae bacterium]|jgi:mRNA interferase MazF|nr:type II toxin-antitoxin system PemK/MazF family toxin [Pyrinomonadaceae bacterium]